MEHLEVTEQRVVEKVELLVIEPLEVESLKPVVSSLHQSYSS